MSEVEVRAPDAGTRTVPFGLLALVLMLNPRVPAAAAAPAVFLTKSRRFISLPL